jgi:uncharacterized membrane protein
MTVTANNPRVRADTAHRPQFPMPLFLFGIGLGGLVDGIALHQILQWHHVISNTDDGPTSTVAGLEANTLADGLFHAFAFLVILLALYLAMRARREDSTAMLPSWGEVTGWLLVGWGVFNLVEGLVDHHLLRLHHVRDDVSEPLPWDLGFLAVSLVLLLVGWALVRRGAGDVHPRSLTDRGG